MKSVKKTVLSLICVILSCILAICITFGLLTACSADSTTGSTANPDSDSDIDSDTQTPESEPELEWGYKFKYISGIVDGGWIGNIAYRSAQSTFNVDDVTLTVSFGSFSAKYGPEECDVPEYDIYFANPSVSVIDSIYTVKTVQEQFFSEKYCITSVVDEGKEWDYHYEFNHTEEITIPKELFTESEGIIHLMIAGTKIGGSSHYANGYLPLCEASIKYQLNGTDVVLSPAWER